MTRAKFEQEAPELAQRGNRLFGGEGDWIGFISTVARDGRQRIAPVCPISTQAKGCVGSRIRATRPGSGHRRRAENDLDRSAVRYMVTDVDAAVAFYTEHLGFQLERRWGPPFAILASKDLELWISGPGTSPDLGVV